MQTSRIAAPRAESMTEMRPRTIGGSAPPGAPLAGAVGGRAVAGADADAVIDITAPLRRHELRPRPRKRRHVGRHLAAQPGPRPLQPLPQTDLGLVSDQLCGALETGERVANVTLT